jgi:eukaryotic-like serine/threonine-protein kinase
MIGHTLSHYLITSELGRGGMGVVYRARDQLLNRDVALKLMLDNVVNQRDRRTRVLAEARAASALNHPGITTIYDVVESGEHLFIVMELVEGQTLRARLSSAGPMEARELARLGAQIAEALDAAHSHGVVHGDIKPENIVLQAAAVPKLFDFGIARQMAAETVTLTRSNQEASETPRAAIAGTVAYMPPEILKGEVGDSRSDLYSLGVVLFEVATHASHVARRSRDVCSDRQTATCGATARSRREDGASELSRLPR